MSLSSSSLESAINHTATASTRTNIVARATSNRSSTSGIINTRDPYANDSRDTERRIPERPSQSGSRHEYRASQVLSDTFSSTQDTDIATQVSLLSESERATLETIQSQQDSIPHTIPEISTTVSDKSLDGLLTHFVLEAFPAHLKPWKASKIILILHDYGGNELSLRDFAEEHLKEPETLYILLRGTHALNENHRYSWADDNRLPNRSFLEATGMIGKAITEGLIKKHNIPPRSIVLFGHGQGGMVALSIAASWNRTELGGVITVGGPLADHFILPLRADISTPVLVLGGMLGDINATATKRIRDFVKHVDVYLAPDVEDLLPQRTDTRSLSMLKEFLAHRLRRKEWEQPSVLTFDGGGIRGYGSLLIVKELMNRIGIIEKKLNPETHSSFHPQPFRPTTAERQQASAERPLSLERRSTNYVQPSSIDGLQNSDLFYPCHYFSYIGGTSTGGLISIMLSRLRMSVEDSLNEYRRLGGEVFGSPRPIPNKGILWHKFSSQRLERVIDEVIQKHHTPTSELGITWPSEPDFCRTVVIAYASTETTETPYLFRTYEVFAHPETMERTHAMNKVLNPGGAQNVNITAVARATSAAPGYFTPAEIRISERETIKFKDGGFGRNNPSDVVRRDISQLHGGSNKDIGPFISVGTGVDKRITKFPEDGAFRHIRGVWRDLKTSTRMTTLTRGAHENMLDNASDGDTMNFPYFRFDGGRRLGNLKMDAWAGHKLVRITGRDPTPGCKTIEEMDTAVVMYLQDPDVSANLDAAAELLVRRRRYRIRDESQWDRYACASWYQCPYACKESKRHNTLNAFRNHVLKVHKMSVAPEVLEPELAKYRHCWSYPVRETGADLKTESNSGGATKNTPNGWPSGQAAPHTNGVVEGLQVEP